MKRYLIAIFLLCCGCGFAPMHKGQAIDIYVAPITGTNGIDLRNALNAKFGSDNSLDSKYKLVIKLNEPITKYKAIQMTGDATWQEVKLGATYTLSSAGKSLPKVKRQRQSLILL